MLKKILIALVVLILIGVGYYFSKDYLSFTVLKERQAEFVAYYDANQFQVLLIYFIVYIATTALSLPGAAILTLAAGALFGVVVGSILVSFASSIGATCAFLVARYLVGESLQKKYTKELEKFNTQFDKEGAFYLFALRLVPAFPFFLINILMALTKIKVITFYWVSQLGMLAGTIVYVNAGTQIAKLDSLKGILSPALIASFVLLAIIPFIAKKAVEFMRKKREAQETSQS